MDGRLLNGRIIIFSALSQTICNSSQWRNTSRRAWLLMSVYNIPPTRWCRSSASTTKLSHSLKYICLHEVPVMIRDCISDYTIWSNSWGNSIGQHSCCFDGQGIPIFIALFHSCTLSNGVCSSCCCNCDRYWLVCCSRESLSSRWIQSTSSDSINTRSNCSTSQYITIGNSSSTQPSLNGWSTHYWYSHPIIQVSMRTSIVRISVCWVSSSSRCWST